MIVKIFLIDSLKNSAGFSPRKLNYMPAFAEVWPDTELVQQAPVPWPWFHFYTLFDKLKTPAERRRRAADSRKRLAMAL